MTRFKAAGLHLIFSIVVGLFMLFLVLGVWYPGGYFKLMGIGSIYLLLMGVDVCLGPLLTLAVYKHGKKGMKFDLSVIAILQIAALLYGATIVFQGRPIFNVLEGGAVFKVATAIELSDKALVQAAKPEWRKLSITGPVLVAATAPTDPKVREEVILAGGNWYNFPKVYVEYDSQRKVALQNAKPLSDLRKISAESASIIDRFMEGQKRPESDFVYLPIVNGYSYAMTAVLNAENADIVEIIDIDTP